MTNARLGTPTHGIVLALLSALCIGAWAVHQASLSGLARVHQSHGYVIWIMQGFTVATAAPCILTVLLGWKWLRETSVSEDEGSPVGRTVFMCWMAIFVGLFNLALIILQAIYVSLLHSYV